MSLTARQIVLVRRPVGALKVQDFTIRTVELGAPCEGEVLVRNLWLSLDPYMRLFMGDQGGLHGSIPLGEAMPGGRSAK
jgi:NADPH-dependent curcumin reductase CurA